MNSLSLGKLKSAFRDAGAVRLVAKSLAENDNSKNQIYLAGSLEPLNVLPFESPRVVRSAAGREVIHAAVKLSWLTDDGTPSPAPHTKLILYPQYPEVRLSGFLKGAADAPNALMNEDARIAGRVLLLGIRADRSIVARVFAPGTAVVRELRATGVFEAATKTLVDVPLETESSRAVVLRRLREIATEGWIDSQRLDSTGARRPCDAMNCGGLTLEARLGIIPNSRSEPDFHGWEVKQFAVRNFVRFAAKSPVTLFTPEPTSGVYSTEGVEAFVRRYGYADTKGRHDRRNFGGRFVVGSRNEKTGLTLRLDGYDAASGKISELSGGLTLTDDDGVSTAGWPFAALIEHWNRKHAQAAYVPSLMQRRPRKYRYASTVFLGAGTDFARFVKAVAEGAVYYDPGIKLEDESSDEPRTHRRSQFRIAFKKLAMLYREFERDA